MTVVNGILSKRPLDLRIRRGTCCIKGCTLIITSGWYFSRPFATSLHKEVAISERGRETELATEQHNL